MVTPLFSVIFGIVCVAMVACFLMSFFMRQVPSLGIDVYWVAVGGELLGIAAGADASIERVDPRKLLGGESKVEHVEVLNDSLCVHRLGDCREAVVEVPADDDLCGCFAVLIRKLGDQSVLQRSFGSMGDRV